jgi:saccharopine dehydrogenase-like NADP-dependent oxidoreductase
MSQILVLGAGRMGEACALDLLNSGLEVAVADYEESRARVLSERLGCPWITLDVEQHGWTRRVPHDVHTVCTSLPRPLAYGTVRTLAEEGFNVTDVTTLGGGDPYSIGELVEREGRLFVAYAGLAPGLSHVLVGRLYHELGRLDSATIYVGGLPQDPAGKPLFANLTFSAVAYLDQYSRASPARVNGETIELDPFDNTGDIQVPGIGTLEYFSSGALHTLLDSFPDITTMSEYTLRWPGHIDHMRTLRDLGFLSKEKIDLGKTMLSPIEFLGSLLESRLAEDPRDLVVLMVDARREDNNSRYLLTLEYDEERGLTAMARATGFTQSVMTQMSLKGELPSKE